MSERILKALMQLFAIVANIDGLNDKSREVVHQFLRQRLNQELIEEYLQLYDVYLEAHHQISKKKKDGTKKRTSLNSVKVLRICTQINSELTQKQKIFVLSRIIEYVNADRNITHQEMEFVTTVADIFNVQKEELELMLHFLTAEKADDLPDSEHILVINATGIQEVSRNKFIMAENMISEQVNVMHVDSVGTFFLRHFGSYELFLNGQVIGNDRSYILTQGSSIRSSRVSPIYYSDVISTFLSDKTESKIVFTAKDLTYRFKTGNIGLNPLTFSEESGKLIGIMGASGSGKSTLLNLLNGNYKPTTGEVTINGINIHTDPDNVNGVIGYISQDDLLLDDLTVFQNLALNARLCFDHYSDQQIKKTVLHMLNVLGLYETKDLKVGNPLDKTISGGQRKRLNIALELMREPSVLFVDEPTSGLSSRDSENIMDLLKELALKGKIVFVVIHQPSSDIFKMFDKLLIMDTGGFPIYYGNPLDSILYFKTMANQALNTQAECHTCGNVNPEQIFNIIESKVLDEYGNTTDDRKILPHEWNKTYLQRIQEPTEIIEEKPALPKIAFKIPNKFKQWKVFSIRDLLTKVSNKQYLLINLLEAPALAFVLSYFLRFYDVSATEEAEYSLFANENIPAYMFIAVIVALFLGLSVSAEEIIKDSKIRKRESFLNLSNGSYLMSKILIMFALSALQMATFVLLGNTILDIGLYLDYWLILFSTACFANMLGLNISASFNSAVTIYILIPFLIIPQLLFSGVIVKFDKLNPTITTQTNVPLIGEVMTSRWAFEALAVNQFKNNDFEKEFYYYDKEKSKSGFKKNYWIPEMEARIGNIENNLDNEEKRQQVENNLLLVRNELTKENVIQSNLENEELLVPAEFLDGLTYENTTKEKVEELRGYVKNLYNYYILMWQEMNKAKDNLIREKTKDKDLEEIFRERKRSYTNESLNDLVSNKTEINQIKEIDNELIQRADPIFMDSESFRAHFYAPSKRLFGNRLDTFWANMIVIWTMSLILGISLYFDGLRKLINLLGKFSFNFAPKSKPNQAK